MNGLQGTWVSSTVDKPPGLRGNIYKPLRYASYHPISYLFIGFTLAR